MALEAKKCSASWVYNFQDLPRFVAHTDCRLEPSRLTADLVPGLIEEEKSYSIVLFLQDFPNVE